MNNFFNAFGMGQPYQQNPRQQKAQWHDSLKAIPSYMAFREDIDVGNKILLPASVLNIYSKYQVPQPLIFCIQNTFLNKITFVGVLEFVASEQTCVLPAWIFEQLQLEVNQIVSVALNTEIPQGKFVKIQPHETAFIDLPDPRAIMEVQLRNYICVREGDTIQIEFNQNKYKIDIIDIKPKNAYKAINLYDTDIEVDFAPPKDYVELPKQNLMKKTSSVRMEEEEQQKIEELNNPFKGSGQRLDGKPINANNNRKSSNDQTFRKSSVDVNNPRMLQNQLEEYDPRKHRLINGVKRNLINNNYEGQGIKLGETKGKK